MSTFEATLHQLPKPLLDKLRAIIGRVRRLLFIRGFFATLAVALACLLIIMAIDASVTLFSSAARWALSLTGLAITALTAWWFLIRPLSRRFTLTHIARILEIRHPELQERISTAVELMSSKDPDSVRGSQELIGAVVDSAVVDVNKVDPKTEFQGRRASRVMLVAGVAAALFLVLFAIFPRHIGVLAARAFAPFMDIGNAWSDTLTVKPGDIQVAIGQAVTIEMTVKHDKMRRADLRRKLPDGTESVERMQFMGDAPDGAKRFAVTFPAVDQSFDYRIRAGSAVSEFFSVEAVPKPAVEKLSFRYEFPAYTKREPVEAPSENGEIAVLAHSKVTVIAATNKPVTEANFQIVGQEIESQPVIEPGQVSWSFTLAPKTASRWRAKLKDGNGFESDPIDYPVTALPDRAPQIKIVSPAVKELKLRPTELVPVKYDAAEDIGLADVTMLVAVEGEAAPREIAQPKPESDGQAGTWHGAAELNLASLNLQPNQKKVVVQLRARDTLPTEFEGPNQGLSDKLTIIIDNNARTLAEQTLAAQKEEIRKAIDSAKQELAQAKQEAQQAERELAREEKVNPQAMRELDEFRERANKAQETLRQVAQRTEDTVFEPQGEQLEKVADTEVAEAREAADMIPVSDKREERVAEAKTAQKEVDKAITELAKIEKTLNDADKEMKTVAELSQLANEQRQLAQKAQQQAQQQQQAQKQQQAQPQQPQGAQPQPQMTPEQMKQLAQFQAEQARIQQQLGEKLKDSPKALRDILAQQQQEAAQLAQQAKQAAQEQTDLQKMAEAAAAQNNPDKQEALKEQLMASLEQRQQQIAQETGQLKEQLNQQQAQAGKPLENAAQETQQAAESLQQKGETAENMQAASQAAKEASKALSQASEQAEKMAAQQEQQAGQQPNQQQMAQANQPQPGQPQQMAQNQPQPQPGQPQPQQMAQNQQPQPGQAQPQPGEPQAQPGQPQPGDAGEPQQPAPSPLAAEPARQQLAQLAQEQEMIAEQLEAIQAGDFQAALGLMEQQVGQEAQEIGEGAETLAQATQAAQQAQAAQRAATAERALENASQQAQQAAERLANTQMAQNAADKAQGQAQQAQAQAQQAQAQAQEAQAQAQKAQPGQAQAQAQAAAQQAQARAQQAQTAANQAQAQAKQAQGQAQQMASQSSGSQQQAQSNLNQAAQSLEQTAQSLAQALQNMKATPEQQSDVLNPQNLSEAFSDTGESAQSQNAQQAAQNAQQAAQSLQELAQAAMQQLAGNQPGQQPQQGNPQQPGQQPQQQPGQFADNANPQLNESGQKNADINGDGVPPELKALGITAADWSRLKGNLQSGAAAQGGDDLPGEYRDLVGRYFQVIAREAAKSESK
jgi:hypothetical protein